MHLLLPLIESEVWFYAPPSPTQPPQLVHYQPPSFPFHNQCVVGLRAWNPSYERHARLFTVPLKGLVIILSA